MADWLAVPTEASKVGFKLRMFGPVLDNGPVGETATLCDERQKKMLSANYHSAERQL